MTISYIAAFLGGVIALLSPCSGILLPTFFAYTFKQKTKLVLATIIFYLGLMAVFIPLGLGISILSRLFVQNQVLLFQIAGTFLLTFGALTLAGRGMPEISSGQIGAKYGLWGIFFMGAISGFTLGSCVGPILGAILTLAALSADAYRSISLMLVYGLGLVLPLLILSLAFEKLHWERSPLIQGKLISFKLFGQDHYIHSINLIAGMLFILLGITFLFFHGSFGFIPFFQGSFLDFFFSLQESIFNL